MIIEVQIYKEHLLLGSSLHREEFEVQETVKFYRNLGYKVFTYYRRELSL